MVDQKIILSDKELAIYEDDEGRTSVPLSALQTATPHLLLPDFCRLHIPNRNGHVFVIEHPPCTRHVRWKPNAKEWDGLIARGGKRKCKLEDTDATREVYRLAFPYTVFLVSVVGLVIERLQLFFRTKPIHTINDTLFCAGLTTDDTWIVPDQTPFAHHGMSSASVTAVAIEQFWELLMGSEQSFGAQHPNVAEVASIWEWEHFSQKPDWIFTANWTAHNNHLIQAVQKMSHPEKQTNGTADDPLFHDLSHHIIRTAKNVLPTSNSDFVESARLSMVVGTTRIRCGDELCAKKTDGEIKKSQTYLVIGFYETTAQNTKVFVRFEGIEGPVCIGHSGGLQNFSHVTHAKEIPNEIICDGIVLKKGVSFKLTDTIDLPGLHRHMTFTISDLRVDEDGDAHAQLHGGSQWFCLTYDGGKLLPSIKLLMPQLTGDTFTYGDVTLSVGMTVQIWDKILQVTALSQKAEIYYVWFNNSESPRALFYGTMQIKFEVIHYALSDRRVEFRDKVLDLTQTTHLLVVEPKLPLQYGTVYKMEALRSSTRSDTYVLDVDLIIANGNEPIPVIRDSVWVFPDGYLPTSIVYQDKNLTLRAGEELICCTESEELGLKKDESLTILCFVNRVTDPKETEMVFTDGRAILLTQTELAVLKRKIGKAFTKKELSNLPEKTAKTRDIQVGDHVVGVLDWIQGFVGEVTKVSENDIIFVTFFEKQPNHRQPRIRTVNGLRNYWAHAQMNPKIAQRFISTESSGVHILQKDGTTIPISDELCVEWEKIRQQDRIACGTLADGTPLFVGDFITAKESGFSDVRFPRELLNKPLLIVHYAQSSWGHDMLFCWSGSSHSGFNVRTNTSGADTLPKKFSLDGGVAGQLVVISAKVASKCEVKVVEPTLTPDPVRLNVGQSVILLPNHSPRFLVGQVTQGEIGLITQILPDDCVLVDFPHQANWVGHLTDLTLAS